MPVLSNMEIRGMEKGRQQGILLNARESVIEVLETRFGHVNQEIRDFINQIEDISRLKQLHRQAIVIPSLEEFQPLLVESQRS